MKLIKHHIKFTELTCVLVLELVHHEETIEIGALVDKVNEVLEINVDQIIPFHDIKGIQMDDMIIEGMVQDKEKFIMLLNTVKLFNTQLLTSIEKELNLFNN